MEEDLKKPGTSAEGEEFEAGAFESLEADFQKVHPTRGPRRLCSQHWHRHSHDMAAAISVASCAHACGRAHARPCEARLAAPLLCAKPTT